MDPNANLEELRRLVRRQLYDNDLTPAEVTRLAELVEALDEWIAKGGFLPSAWAKGPNARS